MTSIPVLDPRISVVLKKNVAREFIAGNDGLGGKVPASARFRGMQREIDLTPYLGEAGGVRTTKSVRDPAGGFTVTLADRMYIGASNQMESLYGLIEPMDVVEIRMAHAPTSASVVGEYMRLPHRLPIVMRGFVSGIRRTEVMGPDGRPQRAVQITGQDYGKLWQIIQIKYLPNYVMGQNLLTYLRFAQNYGMSAQNMAANEFIHDAVDGILNEFTKVMRQSGDESGDEDEASPVRDIELFDLTVPNARVSPFGLSAFDGGTLYQLLAHYGDVGPWNELFIQDREEGVAVVYRPNPFKRPDGEFIQPISDPYESTSGGTTDSPDLRKVMISDADIVSNNTGRTDAGLANYYWVDSPAYQLVNSSTQRLFGANDEIDTYYIEQYRNSAPWLYGLRIAEVQTNQGSRIDGQPAAALNSGRGELADWLATRRKTLVEANRDNVIFESGQMTLRGNERIRAGDYLGVVRGSLEYEAYVTQVDHIFMPFRTYTTNVTVERGTGFVERAQKGRGRQSAYLAEMNGRGVYGGGQ